MLHVVKIKGCKRCGGDLFLERDAEETQIFCLQCGAVYLKHSKPSVPKLKIEKVFAR
jgi:transcription initiation factor TFIIIB Brf1 subunit/transcription initiation factor TFIIB